MPAYAGIVTFTYEAYSVPDKFTVYAVYEDSEWVLFDTFVQVSGSATIKIFKPFGVTRVKIKVEGPPGTAWTYYISCPEKDDKSKYCGPVAIGSDEKTGATPMGGSYLSGDECVSIRNNDSVKEVDSQPQRVTTSDPPSLPTTGPNSGGYFPTSINYGYGKLPCSSKTHTNTTQPPYYNLLISGTYISNDPDVYFYYISKPYPAKAGRIIFNCISGLSQNPINTPRRRVAIWAFRDLINGNAIPLQEFTIEPENAGANWCSTIEKPPGYQYIVVTIAEDNPSNARALFSLNFSGLVTSDNDLFQIQSDDNVYQSRVVNLGDSSGIVDFYASIYMSNDLFVACTNVSEPNLLPDPLKDLPRAKFRVSDNNNAVLLEFTIDARSDLQNIPPLASKLTSNNTFVDRLETLFKKAEAQELRIETWYSRNTVFRWTIGCPRSSCFSLCNLTDTPSQIAVELEAEDYSFEYKDLGADIYRNKNYNRGAAGTLILSDEKSGPSSIPLAAGLTFGPASSNAKEYISLPIGSPHPDRNIFDFVRRDRYNAIWGVPAKKYDGTFILTKQNNGDYKFTFEDPETCPEDTNNPTEIILKTGISAECGLWMNNFKCFWKWGLGQTATKLTCDTIWDWENFIFSGYSCMNHSFSVGCESLKTGGVGLERNVLYFLRGRSSFIKLQSAYDDYASNYSLIAFNRVFNTDPCFDVPNVRCGRLSTNRIAFGGIEDISTNYPSIIRSCYLEFPEYSPVFQFPYVRSGTISDKLKTFSTEIGKPYITVKSIRAIF